MFFLVFVGAIHDLGVALRGIGGRRASRGGRTSGWSRPLLVCFGPSHHSIFLQVRQIASLTEQVKNAEQQVEAFRNQVAQQNADIHAMATELTVGRLKIAELQKELDKAHALFTGFRQCFFPVEGKHAEEGAEGARQGASVRS